MRGFSHPISFFFLCHGGSERKWDVSSFRHFFFKTKIALYWDTKTSSFFSVCVCVCGICPLYNACVGFLVALSELVTEAGWQKHCKARPLLLVADSDQVCPDALGTCCQLRTVSAVRGLCCAPHRRQKLQERRKVCPRQHVLQLWSKRNNHIRTSAQWSVEMCTNSDKIAFPAWLAF